MNSYISDLEELNSTSESRVFEMTIIHLYCLKCIEYLNTFSLEASKIYNISKK